MLCRTCAGLKFRVATLGLFTMIGVAAPSAVASDDLFTISVTLPYPEGSGPDGNSYYRLAGQSALYTTRTGSFTTGGLLDGLTSSGSFQDISFFEVFPEANLTDYERFGYFGVLETVIDNGFGEQVIDRSLVVAGQFGNFEGLPINSILPFFNESDLVDALINGFDTQPFFDALFSAVGNDDLLGDLALWSQSNPFAPVITVRDGETLGLYAFIDGVPGDEDQAVLIGNLSATVLRVVPAPSTLLLCAVAGATAARRRRS